MIPLQGIRPAGRQALSADVLPSRSGCGHPSPRPRRDSRRARTAVAHANRDPGPNQKTQGAKENLPDNAGKPFHPRGVRVFPPGCAPTPGRGHGAPRKLAGERRHPRLHRRGLCRRVERRDQPQCRHFPAYRMADALRSVAPRSAKGYRIPFLRFDGNAELGRVVEGRPEMIAVSRPSR